MGPYRGYHRSPPPPRNYGPVSVRGLGDDAIGAKILALDQIPANVANEIEGYIQVDTLRVVKPGYVMGSAISYPEFCDRAQRERGIYYALIDSSHPVLLTFGVYVKREGEELGDRAAAARYLPQPA